MRRIGGMLIFLCLIQWQQAKASAPVDSLPHAIVVVDSVEENLAPTDAATTDENLYDYNQLFMFGFLILGAMLVVWKYRNN